MTPVDEAAIEAAWFSESRLARQRRDEQAARDFTHMLARRTYFEASVAQLQPESTDELAKLWRAADERTL